MCTANRIWKDSIFTNVYAKEKSLCFYAKKSSYVDSHTVYMNSGSLHMTGGELRLLIHHRSATQVGYMDKQGRVLNERGHLFWCINTQNDTISVNVTCPFHSASGAEVCAVLVWAYKHSNTVFNLRRILKSCAKQTPCMLDWRKPKNRKVKCPQTQFWVIYRTVMTECVMWASHANNFNWH